MHTLPAVLLHAKLSREYLLEHMRQVTRVHADVATPSGETLQGPRSFIAQGGDKYRVRFHVTV